ncbi:MAG: hypothetical protein JXB44_15450 [Calditrichaceae bacterium]|nr:hypothetical protein [Calditrichaceae bacterium]
MLTEIITKNILVQKKESAIYSEQAVKFKLAIELYRSSQIISILESKIPKKKQYLDIYFCENSRKYGIEVKYKTKLNEILENKFEYTNQSAQNFGKYYYLRDINRLERYVLDNIIDEGYAVLITNDPNYMNYGRDNTLIQKYDIYNGKEINGKYPGIKQKGKEKNDITINGSYKTEWFPMEFKNPDRDTAYFNCCIVKIVNEK